MSKTWLHTFLLAAAMALVGCTEAQQSPRKKTPPQQKQDLLIEQNREFLRKEREQIEAFIAKNEFEMQRTGSGLYYMVLEPAPANAPQITEGQRIEYAYRIALLDGTPIKNSEKDGLRIIRVGKDQVEVGLHEAFMLAKIGSKMLFIVPAHLAHGLSTNADDVPPRSTLIYEIEPLKQLN